MKILHFYKAYLPESIGGVEKVINQIAKSTTQFGFESEVLVVSSNKNTKTVLVDGHLVHRCRSNIEISSTPFSISAVSRFRKLVQKSDIIHYHYPYPFADILHFCGGNKKPTLLTYHSDIIKQKNLLKVYKPLQRLFLNSVDHIVVTSPNYLQTSSDLSTFKNKISVIPIGIDRNSYPKSSLEKKAYWEHRYGQKFFLFVGVLRYYKGLHILIDAMLNSNFPIVIVGAGALEKDLKEQASKLGVNNIHFTGKLEEDDKIALLELCYGFVFPSHLRSEAFGVSLLEGAMYGKPLISCEIGTGTTYINIDNKTGLVVPPNNSAALRHALDYLWCNSEAAATMGLNALSRYQDVFTADSMGNSYADLYNQLA